MDGNLNVYPVVFVPGIMGTTLSDHYPLDHKVVYNAVTDKMMFAWDPVMLDDAGEFDRELTRLIFANEVISMVYGEMVEELRENLPVDEQKSEYVKVYVFPYDWRYSIISNAVKLGRFVDYIIRKSNAHQMYGSRGITVDKVNIVSHSMGGCLSKYFATRLGGEAKINKLVMLASPLRGSLYALKHLIMGETWFFNWFTRKGKRKAARTFSGVYDLLSFDGYFSSTGKIKWGKPAVVYKNEPVNIFDGKNWQTNVFEQIGNSLDKHLGSTYNFFESAADFSESFKDKVFMIYGTGEQTLREVTVEQADMKEYDFPNDDKCKKVGDSTVPAVSTFSEGIYKIGVTKKKVGDWELDLGKLAGFHASFCAYDLVQDLTISFLTGNVIKTVKKEFGVEKIEDLKRFEAEKIDELDKEPEEDGG